MNFVGARTFSDFYTLTPHRSFLTMNFLTLSSDDDEFLLFQKTRRNNSSDSQAIEDEGDTPLIPEKNRACLKLMLQLYTQSSTGSRVRSEDKKEAKLMAKAVARQDVKSAKNLKGQNVCG
jgi:hypothetical protein